MPSHTVGTIQLRSKSGAPFSCPNSSSCRFLDGRGGCEYNILAFRGRPMAGHGPLEPGIQVRVLAPEPTSSGTACYCISKILEPTKCIFCLFDYDRSLTVDTLPPSCSPSCERFFRFTPALLSVRNTKDPGEESGLFRNRFLLSLSARAF